MFLEYEEVSMQALWTTCFILFLIKNWLVAGFTGYEKHVIECNGKWGADGVCFELRAGSLGLS